MTIPAFGPWTEQDHLGEKQARMITRAQLAETSPIPGSVDPVNKTARFYGSKLYDVSLDHCPCGGFHGKAPCKHIYRLAMELGIINLPYKTGISKGEFNETQISFEDALRELQKLPFDALRDARFLLSKAKQDRHSPLLTIGQETINSFRGCSLFEELNQHTAMSLMLSRMKRTGLYEIIEASGIENPPKKNAASSHMAQWLLDYVPNLSSYLPPCAAFSYIQSFDKAQPTMLKWFGELEEVCELLGTGMEESFPIFSRLMLEEHLMPLDVPLESDQSDQELDELIALYSQMNREGQSLLLQKARNMTASGNYAINYLDLLEKS